MAGKCSFPSCQRGVAIQGTWLQTAGLSRFGFPFGGPTPPTLPLHRGACPQEESCPPMQQPWCRGSSLLNRTGVPPHGCSITSTQATPFNASMHLVTCSVEALPVKRNKHPVAHSTVPAGKFGRCRGKSPTIMLGSLRTGDRGRGSHYRARHALELRL